MSGQRAGRTVEFTPVWSSPQRRSLEASVLGRLAYSTGRAVGRWIVAPPVRVRVTRHPAPQAGGSSWIGLGVMGWRTWSATVSWTSGCLVLRHDRYVTISGHDRSASGPAGIRTSASSRSSSGEADTIGQAGHTAAEKRRSE